MCEIICSAQETRIILLSAETVLQDSRSTEGPALANKRSSSPRTR